jgi:hypothetical protein
MIAPKLPTVTRPSFKKRMTIAAAFQCWDGIVLCADTQETYGGIKRKVSKLEVRGTDAYSPLGSTPFMRPTSPCAVFAGSTDDGDFLDALIEKLWRAMEKKGADGLEAMIEAAEDELILQWQRFIPVLPKGVPETNILMGVWAAPYKFELVKMIGPVLKRNIALDSIGCGDVLATYLINRLLYPKSGVTQAIPIGIYMVDQAREHIEGCGGDIHLVVVGELGGVQKYSSQDMRAETARLQELDLIAREIVGLSMEPHNSEFSFDLLLEDCLKRLRSLAVIREADSQAPENQP